VSIEQENYDSASKTSTFPPPQLPKAEGKKPDAAAFANTLKIPAKFFIGVGFSVFFCSIGVYP